MIKRLTMTIELPPVTKKNNMQLVKNPKTGKLMPIQNKRYRQYEKDAAVFIKGQGAKIDYPVNVQAVYYMPTRRRVDLINLHAALHDVLVKYEVLEDDNCKIVVSTDGSRVDYDKEHPRTEVVIEIRKVGQND